MTTVEYMAAINARGVDLRRDRAERKRHIGSLPRQDGYRLLAEHLGRDEWWGEMRVVDFLRLVRHSQPRDREFLLRAAGVSDRLPVSRLTQRQRTVLAAECVGLAERIGKRGRRRR